MGENIGAKCQRVYEVTEKRDLYHSSTPIRRRLRNIGGESSQLAIAVQRHQGDEFDRLPYSSESVRDGNRLSLPDWANPTNKDAQQKSGNKTKTSPNEPTEKENDCTCTSERRCFF
jgi:hypothetical protein